MRASLLFALSLSLPSIAWGVGGEDNTASIRHRGGYYLGLSSTSARLNFSSENARTEVALTSLPSVSGGLDLWPSESLGFQASFQIGLGSEIDEVLTASVPLNLFQLRAQARYRHFFGANLTAISAELGFGFKASIQLVQEQSPSVLINRFIFGPEMRPSVTVPLNDRAWFVLFMSAGVPFFVREWASDTGDPRGFFSLGAGGQICWLFTDQWGIQLDAEYDYRFINFKGAGTRSSGIFGGKTKDELVFLGLSARYSMSQP